ncbi:tetratricopeptide repeat protein [Pseudoalteromonas piscicida]|uniref:Protein prenylyltransferase domain-containing protein n=1 Tax=Pseudoalteromonas piscicida TaxID=43662 RepID=A0A2A5JT66_PSEO7|nr:tetratricopeptide repeat protein [Pseudoalteromonas piscicida]PCK32653.1 protein prenylyltransferase domain-containing protein [Pseudoalteromonas piscicida]
MLGRISKVCVALALLGQAPFANAGLEEGIDALNAGRFEEALQEFNYLAEMNYAPGIYQLGVMYEGGYGVIKNQRKAAELYKKAVKLGEADAMFALAVMYDEGRGVKKDRSKYVELMQRAANKNMPAAQFNVALMYSNGDGVPQDYRHALNWYEKAAANNYTLAMFNLALMYFQGLGVEKNIERSYVWNTLAEFNGYAEATKSRLLDEKQLSPSQIERAKELANSIYERIQAGKYVAETRTQ